MSIVEGVGSATVETVRFRDLTLAFGPGAFHPQPETEALVAWILDNADLPSSPLVVDLCSGCGTLALALAAELPSAKVHAVERSADALVWLNHNIVSLQLPVEAHLGDAEHAVSELDGSVDLVVSNPPYVATPELRGLAGTVNDRDPTISLDGGSDGLDIIRAVASSAQRLLRAGGLLVIEHSDRQGQSAPRLLRDLGWSEVQDHVDQAGRDRFVTARRTAPRGH